MLITPPSIFTSADGTKNGEILRGPRSKQILEFFSIFGKPPIPAAELIPNSSGSNSLSPQSFIASSAATCPSTINLSSFFTSFGSTTLSGLKSLISAAICTGNSLGSNSVIFFTPVFPSQMALNELFASLPRAFIIPMPVTTTLFIKVL